MRAVFENTFAVNAFGTAITAEAFLPLLKRSKVGPRIVNVGSGAGSCTNTSKPGYTVNLMVCLEILISRIFLHHAEHVAQVYKSSKSALNSITISLALANPEVHVVVLCPGRNVTGMNKYGGGMDPSEGSKVIVDYALERKGKSPGFYNAQGELPW